MLLLKVIECSERRFARGLLFARGCGWKAQLEIEKHGSGMMMLVKVTVRNISYGKSENRKVRRSI